MIQVSKNIIKMARGKKKAVPIKASQNVSIMGLIIMNKKSIKL